MLKIVFKANVGIPVGIGLIAFSVWYEGGFPLGVATAGEVVLFYLGFLLVFTGFAFKMLPIRQEKGIATISIFGTLILVFSISLMTTIYLSDIESTTVLADRVVLSLLLFPPTVGIWTGVQGSEYPGIKGEYGAYLLISAIITYLGSMAIGGGFALAGFIYGLYSFGALLVGIGIHLFIRY